MIKMKVGHIEKQIDRVLLYPEHSSGIGFYILCEIDYAKNIKVGDDILYDPYSYLFGKFKCLVKR